MGEGLLRTPLFDVHRSAGARMVPFAGWEMPLQFRSGIIHEHKLVREKAGLFDVSHMGRIFLRGSDAVGFANYLVSNNVAKLASDQLLYSVMCNERGGIIDDVTVYRLEDGVLIVCNAANRGTVLSWIRQHLRDGVAVEDATESLAQVALQGPLAESILRDGFAGAAAETAYYHYRWVEWRGERVLMSRNGYTGEDGFEIYMPASLAVDLWTTLMDWGSSIGLEPIGLGARDTLRMEVNYPLYGNELDQETTPLEAGLRWVVKFKKGDFIGREALLRQKEEGIRRTLVGFEVMGRRLPRHGQKILYGGSEVGFVTSGGFCPSLGKGMGMGFVRPDLAEVGTELRIEAGKGLLEARVVERPFYKEGSVKR